MIGLSIYRAAAICFCSVMLICAVNGQERMTLPKAISIALENSYNIKIDDKLIAVAETNNSWAAAGRAPSITLNGTFANNLINDNNPASFLQGTYYTGSLGASVNANMVVCSGGRIQVAKDQLELIVEQEKLNKALNMHELLRSVSQAYYQVIFEQERLYVLREAKALSMSKLEYEKVKKAYGRSNSLDLIQFENAMISDSISVVAQELQLSTAKSTLYTLLRLPMDSAFDYEELLSVTDESIDVETLKATLEESNYTLRTLYVLSDLSLLNTTLAKAQRRPLVSISGGVGIAENAFKFFQDDPNTGEPFELLLSNRLSGNLGATASWNVYDGGVTKAGIATADLEADIAQLSVEQATADLTNQLDILAQNYNTQRQLIALTDEQINLATENLEMLDERLKQGQATSLDYRTVQLQNISAAFAKVNAIYNLILTKNEIDYLVGKFESN